MTSLFPALAAMVVLSTSAMAQDHSAHKLHMQPESVIAEPGQSAFATIQEIVDALQSDPETDWSRVDIDALRTHLVDMDNVFMRAQVATLTIARGAEFLVTSSDPSVRSSIQAMVIAHAATMNGGGGLQQAASLLPDGASLRVTGDPSEMDRIVGLGFFGILSLGAHHQQHHLAMARGAPPHAHVTK